MKNVLNSCINNSCIYFTICFTMLAVISATTSISSYAQNEAEFQNYLAKIQPVLSKSVDKLTNADILLLDDAIALDPEKYGAANRRLCTKIKIDATSKKNEYRDYIERARNMSKTLDDLDNETARRRLTESQRDSLADENSKLQSLINDLNLQIKQFKYQAEKIAKMNKKIQEENLAVHDLLQNSSNLVAQMLLLMPEDFLQNAQIENVPKDITDSLANAQCIISKLLKTNFTTTLQTMRADAEFMETAALYLYENKKYDDVISAYISESNELIARLRNSGVECAIDNAADIENELNDFLIEIEKLSANRGISFVGFIKENLMWLTPLLLVLAVGVTVVIMKTKK